jgi:hypothetical protein
MADFLDAAVNFIDYYFEEKEYANAWSLVWQGRPDR